MTADRWMPATRMTLRCSGYADQSCDTCLNLAADNPVRPALDFIAGYGWRQVNGYEWRCDECVKSNALYQGHLRMILVTHADLVDEFTEGSLAERARAMQCELDMRMMSTQRGIYYRPPLI